MTLCLSHPSFSSVLFLPQIPEVRECPLSIFHPCRPKTGCKGRGAKWETGETLCNMVRQHSFPRVIQSVGITNIGFQNQAGPSQSLCPLIGNRTFGLWLQLGQNLQMLASLGSRSHCPCLPGLRSLASSPPSLPRGGRQFPCTSALLTSRGPLLQRLISTWPTVGTSRCQDVML